MRIIPEYTLYHFCESAPRHALRVAKTVQTSLNSLTGQDIEHTYKWSCNLLHLHHIFIANLSVCWAHDDDCMYKAQGLCVKT